MKLDLRPRCENCKKMPRGKLRLAAYEQHAPYCSYHCQQIGGTRKAAEHLRTLREAQ